MRISPQFTVVQDGQEVLIDRERTNWPVFSEREYQRRWDDVQAMMQRLNLSCLLVTGGEMHWGKGWSNVRWLTNYYGATDPLAIVFIPRRHDPILVTRYYHPAVLAQSVVDEIRFGANPGPVVYDLIREWGYERGHIGIVEHNISIPRTSWDAILREPRHATYHFVSDEFLLTRWQKSAEEIDCLRNAARVGDGVMREIVRAARPGMTEHELYGIAYKSIYDGGGEPGMVLLSRDRPTDPVRAPAIHPQSKVPMYHAVREGDLLLAEVGPLYRGYEALTGKPVTLGAATDDLRRLFELCAEADRRVARALAVGKIEAEVLTPEVLGDEIRARVADGRLKLTLHGMHGTIIPDGPIWRLGPSVISSEHRGALQDFEVAENTVWSIEIWNRDDPQGPVMFLADSYLVTTAGAERLSQIEPQLFEITDYEADLPYPNGRH